MRKPVLEVSPTSFVHKVKMVVKLISSARRFYPLHRNALNFRYFSVRTQSLGPVTTTFSQQQEICKHETGQKTEITFDDPKQAFGSKTSLELLRALLVFKLCSVNFLVNNNQKVSPRKMLTTKQGKFYFT